MEHKLRVLPPEVLMEQLLALLEEAQSVPLVISGSSMSPFLVHGRDTVYLSKIQSPVKRGDMILYRRDNGAYILHRVWKISDGRYCFVGDAQTGIEGGIRQEQLLARVTAVRRKGKLVQPGGFWWEFFEKAWLGLRPLRPVLVRCYTLLTGRSRGDTTND